MSDDVLMFFSKNPGALPIYEELERRVLAALPGTRVEAARTQISFKGRHLFACASFLPVRRAAQRPRVYLTVTFGLGYKKISPRIDAAAEVRPTRWTHHVLVTSPQEIDDELTGWIMESFELSEGGR